MSNAPENGETLQRLADAQRRLQGIVAATFSHGGQKRVEPVQKVCLDGRSSTVDFEFLGESVTLEWLKDRCTVDEPIGVDLGGLVSFVAGAVTPGNRGPMVVLTFDVKERIEILEPARDDASAKGSAGDGTSSRTTFEGLRTRRPR